MIRLGRKRIKSPAAVLRGINLYIRLLMGAGVMMSAFIAAPARAQLPVPCGGACTANGGPAVWVTAGQVQAPTVVGNTMNITQQSDKAILNWASFNVDAGSSVNFSQPAASSVALNRIYQGDPSRIMGTLHANGQVYLINQNGIVFGNGAVVDVHGLVASTLDVSDQVFNSTGIAQAINQGQAAFVAKGQMGDINIEQGAVIDTADGGQVMIFAPNIVNAGEINTPQGQTILAASQDKVYLKVNSPSHPELRGFLVEVKTGGTVQNLGKIIVGEGNATLMGSVVNQDGLVSAGTSVQLNGSIRLLARDNVVEGDNGAQLKTYSQTDGMQIATRTGTVSLGENSVTQVVPDLSDTSTAVDDQAQLPSTVSMMGQTIHLKSGAKVLAPGGKLTMTATVDPTNAGTANLPRNASRILLEAQSLIDVSGTDSVVLPVERNVVDVQLRGNELKDSPVQRDGILYGQTVSVDIRKGTPLADVSGAVNNIKRGVGERTAAGGTVTASSEGDFILNKNAAIDISGGKITYQGGYLNTTKLYSQSDGRVVDIGDADPNKQYTAVLGSYQQHHSKWDVTESFQSPGIIASAIYEPGYVEGKDAGSLNIQARGVILDGALHGSAIAGPWQRLPSAPLASGQPVWARRDDEVPLGGSLIIGDAAQMSAQENGKFADFRTPAVVFKTSTEPTPLGIDDPLPADQTLDLSPDLFTGSGINRVDIYSNGTITVPADAALNLAPGGELTLVAGSSTDPADPSASIAPSLIMDGTVTIPGGQLTLSSRQTRAIGTGKDSYQAIVLGSAAKIDLSGMWVNDSPLLNPGGAVAPVVIDGGALTVETTGDVSLSAGSVADVSGGAQVLADGQVNAGNGGDVTLASDGIGATTLSIDGELRSDALGKGGTLDVTADGIRIQDAATDYQARDGELVLDSNFFESHGFNSYKLKATKLGVAVADNTQLDLSAENRVLDSGYTTQPTGTPMAEFSHLELLPEPQRHAVDLSLTSQRGLNADPKAGISLATGSLIQTEPGAQVTLRSDRMISVAGTIDAPAGNISLTLDKNLGTDGFLADKAIWLTDSARLLAPAYVQLLPNDWGRREGQVLDAGTISLQAKDGFIVTATGSAIDVPGTAQILDILSDGKNGSDYLPVTVAGAAGAIRLTAADGMFLDGALSAKAAAVAGAAGGSLSISLESDQRPNEGAAGGSSLYTPKGPRILRLTGSGDPALPQGMQAGDALLFAAQLTQLHNTDVNSVSAVATVSADRIAQGGFDSVDLQARPVMVQQNVIQPASGAEIAFDGDIALNVQRSITLDAPVLSTQDSRVQLAAPYVAIGPTDTGVRLSSAPTPGIGSLRVTADVIDLIGDTSLAGFGTGAAPAVDLQATQDIRLQGVRLDLTRDVVGSLRTAGDMVFNAAQLYPTTLSQFTLGVEADPEGTIRFTGGDAATAPLSADGVLTVSAPHIVQQGTVRAPFGRIELNAGKTLELDAGSVTSVSGAGLTVPFGQTQFGQDWVVPFEAALLSVVNAQQDRPYNLPLPEKKVSLDAPAVDFAKGAVIDVSGGGDLYAYEFVPGPGGSTDILLPGNAAGAFAVVPTLDSLYAPVDPVISMQGIQAGDSVYLGGAQGLPAGEYAVLPARYALLPGAFLVTPVTGTAGMTPGQSFTRVDGIPVVAGQRRVAGTDIGDSLWSGFTVENGARVRQRAQYTESYAGTFFSADGAASASQLPKDAGNVAINAGEALTLGGHVDGQTPGGRGAQVDIVGQQLSVVVEPSADASGIQILADGINSLGAQSVLLGGQREVTSDGTALNATAQSVDIGPGVNLQVPELMLVTASATDNQGNKLPGSISVENGATLQGSGSLSGSENALLLAGDSALLRVAAGGEPAVQRTDPPSTPSVQLTVAPGAQLAAGNPDANGKLQGGSLILDSAGDAVSEGNIQIGDGGALRLGASRISLGDVGGIAIDQGLVLSNDAIDRLQVANMSLVSASSIDLYGNALVSAGNLTLQAQALNGYSAGDQTAVVQADTLNLIGSTATPSTGVTATAGTLEMKAQAITLGSGDGSTAGAGENLSVNGFNQVNLDANRVAFQGTGRLQLAGTADIASGAIGGARASDWSVAAADALNVLNGTQSQAGTSTPDLGARLELAGKSVAFDGTAILPSGSLTLTASGAAPTDAVIVGSQGVIDVSGTTVNFGNAAVAAPGGQVTLQSAHGDVQILTGAKINAVGGDAHAGGGTISIAASQGQATIAGDLTATSVPGSDAQGNFSLDAASVPDFAAVLNTLSQGGFTGTVAIHSRGGDLVIGADETLKAHDLSLSADGIGVDAGGNLVRDGGNIDIYGQINASGDTAGQVNINAAYDLTLHGSAQIDALGTGSGAKGGSVYLGTTKGAIAFNEGAVIDVTGADLQVRQLVLDQSGQPIQKTDEQGNPVFDPTASDPYGNPLPVYETQTVTRTDTGLVQFRAPRARIALVQDGNGGNQPAVGADGKPVYLITDAQGNTLNGGAGLIDPGANDTVAISDFAGTIKGAGSTVIEAYQAYQPASGHLSGNAVAADASNPYYQDAASFMQNEQNILTQLGVSDAANVRLRPGIELQSRGLLSLDSPLDLSQWRFGAYGQPGVLTLRAAGNVNIANDLSDGVTSKFDYITNSLVDGLRHDDSWSLRAVAGADLDSADPLAVNPGVGNVTIGNNVRVRTGTGDIDVAAGGNLVMADSQAVIYTTGIDGGPGTYDPLVAAYYLDGQYPLGGGDIRIDVGGDISAKAGSQLINDWLPRLGGHSDLGDLPTAWAIAIGNFQQGIGALGGGNVSVAAGGNITDLSVAMPTVATQAGQAVYDLNAGTVAMQTNEVVVTGGDSLSVSAGGDIRGGVFYAGQGQADVNAGGVIGQSPQTKLYPVLALGDTQYKVTAKDDLGIETALNPTVLPQIANQSFAPPSYFFTYGADSSVQLASISGDIFLSNDKNQLAKILPGVSSDDPMLAVYPGSFSAYALQGDINTGKNSFTLYPAARGQLELLAADSVLVGDNQTSRINLSDADPNALPGMLQPAADLLDAALRLNTAGSSDFIHAAVPVHSGDTAPVLIAARDGSIGAAQGTGGQLELYLAKPAWLLAGQDIRNTSVVAQNLTGDDVTRIEAGRDVVFDAVRVDAGLFSSSEQLQVRIAGPGYLEIAGGRNVDLGSSAGVTTVGNLQNPALGAAGANVLVLAGVGATPDYQAFVNRYLIDSDQYQSQLAEFLSTFAFDDASLADVAKFQSLPLPVQRQFIFDVFFNELKESGVQAADSNNQDYSRGFDAINTLFPGSLDDAGGVSGDLNMLLSRIATLDGGGITLIVPRGAINAGVADTSVLQKNADQLGIVVQRSGDIQAYVRGDLLVNQSRVFTLDGGNILIWSSEGNIDAGRGAKTAIAAPPPLVTFDDKGQITLVFPPAIAGSGIRAAVTTPGKPPGDVFLFAPQGIVNAGDAGIGSAGNVTVGAVRVVGADNFDVGGVSVGVPVADTGSLAAGLTGISNVTSNVTKSTEESLDSMAGTQSPNTPLADAALTYLDVVVFGLGNDTVGDGSTSDKPNGN